MNVSVLLRKLSLLNTVGIKKKITSHAWLKVGRRRGNRLPKKSKIGSLILLIINLLMVLTKVFSM